MTRVKAVLTVAAVLVCLGRIPEGVSQSESKDTAAQIVAHLLHEGGASGGIETNTVCADEPKIAFPRVSGADVDAKLKALQTIVPSLRWKKNDTIYRIEIGEDTSGSLMQVVIPATTLVFEDAQDATDQLLGRQEVEENIVKAHLKLFAPPVGYSRVQTTTVDKQELSLPSGTIADDLDRIGKTTGETIWLYSSYGCDGTVSGRLLWIR